MSTSAPTTDPRAVAVSFTDSELVVRLRDGRTVSVPLVWFPRLCDASHDEIANHRLIGDGDGIHWPDLDEDVSVRGLLRGWGSGETLPRAS